ncbi:probable leucine-rich repeat receptor-like protein kinase At1g35710 [Amborella trichopoda]|uniref:probable leucine-rich repeat receptor-like protein kinase At1g35710 n=1 Tax=Amborella trichopoda TaxID=13333 RepID=UPI0009C050DD|nr:probable leucine-rich repeat receptor-like protein kinase At1g35710 [Amborella trichopoda]|eukprot:XP_020527036.1 probable leucine-rich repeat receptor-like protein kinase At1g35710 [Amborella trichopoda]
MSNPISSNYSSKLREVLHAMKMGMVVRSPSFFFFYPFILALSIQSSVLSTVDLEAEALLNWKTSLKNHALVPWFLKTNNSTSHCSWIGIKCNDDGSVVEVNLPNFDLEGTLNQLNFFLLPHLTGLNLSMNYFLQGKIPKSIGSLSKLSFLDLGDNRFTGSVPEEIGNLIELRFISLSVNDLSGPIPYQLGNLQKVWHLDLGRNNLNSTDWSRFTGMESLTHLYLYSNALVDFPAFVSQCKNLVLLDLSENEVSGGIPIQMVSSLENLQVLNLSRNYFQGPIPAELQNLTRLQELQLYGNNLKGSLPPSIGNLFMLSTLSLYNNHFTGSLPPSIGNLSKLTQLWLSATISQDPSLHP